MGTRQNAGLSTLEYHLLLALADQPMHGYGIRDVVEDESGGTLTPRAGTLYRVIARLMTRGLLTETAAPRGETPHPGLSRRYYTLTPGGRTALAEESARLRHVAALARRRLRST